MNLILRQVIGYQQGLKKASTSASPLLKKQLENTQKQLNQILNKWKFGDTPLTTAEEFLANFEPWINRQLESQKELKTFLAKHGLHNLEEIKNVNTPESESEQLKFYKDNIKIKEDIIDEFKEKEQTWNNTEQDYLRRIEELKASRETSELPEDYEDLITERDEALREKKTLEQEILALNNRLNLKNQEVSNKEKALDKLKKEKSQLELTQQKALKEKNTLITTLNQEIKQHKEKYSKQGKLLDEEQLECKKLEEKVEALEAEIQTLKGGRT